MLLAIDVGNTQTHIGAFEGEELVEHWRFDPTPRRPATSSPLRVAGLLELRGIDARRRRRARSSPRSCRGSGPEYAQMCERYLEAGCLMVGPGVKTGMAIRIDNPHELGADRLVNAVAAYDRFGGACAVVDFGTAITFDAVSAEGEYLGGVIGPGVQISMDALTERAARICRRSTSPSPRRRSAAPPRRAIQSGMVYGFAGAIDGDRPPARGRARRGRRASSPPAAAPRRSSPHCETIDEIDDLLTLTGPAADP